jgi:hypothetical protein
VAPERSYEVRWFFDGVVPEQVTRWWAQSVDRKDAPVRTDVYFVVPNRPDLGLKLREGRLELKTRLSCEPGLCGGCPEIWLKDKWALAGSTPELATTGTRLRVVKWRSRRRYRQTTPPLVAELTRITTALATGKGAPGAAADGWTLAIEALGNEAAGVQRAALERGAAALLAGYEGPELTEAVSFGYPEFALRRLNR